MEIINRNDLTQKEVNMLKIFKGIKMGKNLSQEQETFRGLEWT